jgi:hypothetical protein
MDKAIHLILLMLFPTSCKAAFIGTENEIETKKLYFPTCDEKSVKYHTDDYGQRIIGMPPIEPNDSLVKFINDWYLMSLHGMREPILYDKTKESINIIKFIQKMLSWMKPNGFLKF